ncbi:uncharacterized protein LOC112904994 isoform X2 [Agrilus planipennis]|uniref:Uncharacterized protein LOC112904994 isoform X2 n=1 Tax=Agrilus planipennis TaxID=224129 RepID=A0A7F5R8E3_AGRPL|nr:uncharacterized protein LOC112904994 isoform X2 [Agrilus planipennis]
MKKMTCYCGDDEDEQPSSDSELDIEFSPPGLLRHRALKRRNKPKTEADTQYDPADFTVQKPKGKGGKKDKKGGKKGKKK